MRIAYVAPYQGVGIRSRRPIVGNLALAANLKIELIAELLQTKQHQVEILSQGEPDKSSFGFYPAFQETPPSPSRIPVYYCSVLPVKFLLGVWSTWQMLRLIRTLHRKTPFDLMIIYNFNQPQCATALYAVKRLGIPVILEYEDDALVDVGGITKQGLRPAFDRCLARLVLNSISGCIAVSPHLLLQAPSVVPQLLLRGMITPDILLMTDDTSIARNNWVAFSGTHSRSKGLPQLIAAWKLARLQGWELHLAGYGDITPALEESAANDKTIVFHGLLNRKQNAGLLRRSKIGINPHDLSRTPGNLFATKIVEYLAAGTHVITTPMGSLEADLEEGITYIQDNHPETIAGALITVIKAHGFERTAADAARRLYSPEAVSVALDTLVRAASTRTPRSRVANLPDNHT